MEIRQGPQLSQIGPQDNRKPNQVVAWVAAGVEAVLGEVEDMEDLEETPKGGILVDLGDL